MIFHGDGARVANGCTNDNDCGDNGMKIYAEFFSIMLAHNILFRPCVGDVDGANNTTSSNRVAECFANCSSYIKNAVCHC